MWSYLQKKALHTALPRCLEIRFLSCNFGSTKPLPSYAPLWKQQTFDFWSVDFSCLAPFWVLNHLVSFSRVQMGSVFIGSCFWICLNAFDPSTGPIMKRDRFPEAGESPSELIWARKQRCGRCSGPAEPWSQVMCLNIKRTSNQHQIKITQTILVPFMCLVPMQWKEALHYFPRKKWCVPLCWQRLPVLWSVRHSEDFMCGAALLNCCARAKQNKA